MSSIEKDNGLPAQGTNTHAAAKGRAASERNLEHFRARFVSRADFRSVGRVVGLIMTVRLGLSHELDPAQRRQPSGQPQQLRFDNGRIIGLIDHRGELMDDLLKQSAIPTYSPHTPLQPMPDGPAQAPNLTRDSGHRVSRVRTRHNGGFATL